MLCQNGANLNERTVVCHYQIPILALFHRKETVIMLGSLSVLRSLEADATERTERSGGKRQQRTLRSQPSQAQKIEKLQRRRDELLEQLQAMTDSDSGQKKGETGGAATQDEDQVVKALKYLSELKEKLQVYKMTGVSVVKTDPDSKLLCFNTSYRGFYLESYHLQLQRLASGHFKVAHHDLPPFITYATLPADLEVKDMLSAVRPLQEALSMFVLRREELKRAQDKFEGSLQIVESSAALDYLCCHLDIDGGIEGRSLSRGREDLPEDIADSLQSTFSSQDLCTALSTAAKTILLHLRQLDD